MEDRLAQLEAKVTELETTLGVFMMWQMAINQEVDKALKIVAESQVSLLKALSGGPEKTMHA